MYAGEYSNNIRHGKGFNYHKGPCPSFGELPVPPCAAVLGRAAYAYAAARVVHGPARNGGWERREGARGCPACSHTQHANVCLGSTTTTTTHTHTHTHTHTTTVADGGYFIGVYTDGFHHGQGSSTKSDGSTYDGEFARGRPHGKGTLTHADG